MSEKLHLDEETEASFVAKMMNDAEFMLKVEHGDYGDFKEYEEIRAVAAAVLNNMLAAELSETF